MNENHCAEAMAKEIFGAADAESWMTKPKWFFEGLTPRQMLDDEGGEERVKSILMRIAQGDLS